MIKSKTTNEDQFSDFIELLGKELRSRLLKTIYK